MPRGIRQNLYVTTFSILASLFKSVVQTNRVTFLLYSPTHICKWVFRRRRSSLSLWVELEWKPLANRDEIFVRVANSHLVTNIYMTLVMRQLLCAYKWSSLAVLSRFDSACKSWGDYRLLAYGVFDSGHLWLLFDSFLVLLQLLGLLLQFFGISMRKLKCWSAVVSNGW